MTTTGTNEQADRRGRARRPVLLTIMALGAVVSLVGVSGVLAVFTDRATTGENSATSRAEAASADLQIATATQNSVSGVTTCGTYVEDLATGIITASDMAPFGPSVSASVCLKNIGSRTVDLTTSVIDLLDTDTGCTGDEDALDLTCGGDQEGELSGALDVSIYESDCAGFGTFAGQASLAALESTPIALSSLDPDGVVCLFLEANDLALGDEVTTTQSDTTTWKFAFDATAA